MADFPGTPTHETKTIGAGEALPARVYRFVDTLNSTSYSVAVVYPSDFVLVRSSAALEAIKNALVANTHGTLQDERTIRVVGQPAWEVKITTADGQARIRARLVLVTDRVYEAIVVSPAGASDAPATRFLTSLNFLRDR